ncbi:MAG: ABC transporter family substrate-binding protein, partial [Actinocrinis sp.]
MSADTDLAGTSAADTYNSANVQTGGKATWAIANPIADWNLMSGAGDTADGRQVLGGVYPSAFTVNPSYTVTMNSDLLASATRTSTNPQTVVYRIKPDASWSDGTPITAADFAYAWRVQNGSNPAIDASSTAGYDRIKAVTGSGGGKTVTVVFTTPFGDWRSLFRALYPAHVAARHGSDAASFAWFAANRPAVSGGPFELASVTPDGMTIALRRNVKYDGAAAKLDQVYFRAIPNATEAAAALKQRIVDGLSAQPAAALVNQFKSMGSAVTYHIDSGMQFEHIDFNLRTAALGGRDWSRTLRTAMFTAYDRADVLGKTVQAVQPSASTLDSRMFLHNQSGYRDDVAAYGLGTGDVAKARGELADAGFKGAALGGKLAAPDGTAVPALSMKYELGDAVRRDESDLFAADLARLGVTVRVSPTADLGATLTQGAQSAAASSGATGYDIVLFDWNATAFPASANQALYTTGGADNFGGYSNPKVDGWLGAAVSATDPNAAAADLDKADAQLSQDAYTLPLYQRPTLVAFS